MFLLLPEIMFLPFRWYSSLAWFSFSHIHLAWVKASTCIQWSKCCQLIWLFISYSQHPVTWKNVEALFSGDGSSLWTVPVLFPSYGKLTVFSLILFDFDLIHVCQFFSLDRFGGYVQFHLCFGCWFIARCKSLPCDATRAAGQSRSSTTNDCQRPYFLVSSPYLHPSLVVHRSYLTNEHLLEPYIWKLTC